MQLKLGDKVKVNHDKYPFKGVTNPLLAVFGIYKKEPGQRCKNCEHLIRHRNWFKCDLRRAGGPATDHRANWQACGRFVDILPRCSGCGAERLDDCTCPLKNKEA